MKDRIPSSRPWMAVFLTACAVIGTGRALSAGTSNSLMDISADGRLLACSNRDAGSVTVIDLETHRTLREVPVGKKPEGVSFLGDTHELAVAVYAEDKIVVLDADSGRVLGATEVFDEPYGIVSNRSGTKLYVTLDYPGRIVEIETASRDVARRFDVGGRFLRGIALAPDEDRLYVAEYYTADVLAVDRESGRQVDRWTGLKSGNLARQIVLHPSRPKAYLGHIRSRVRVAHGEGSIFPYLSVLDTDSGDESRRRRFPMDSFRGNLVVSNPREVALSPDGNSLYIVFGGTNDMFACEVLDDNYREIALRKYLRLGRNPRAVRVAPDNETFYVYNALDFEVVAYDADRLTPIETIPVCDTPLDGEVLRGKRLFYSALQPMAGRRWISCASCHPDGDSDGRTWQNPEGLRNTPALFGLAWTHPLHWSADRDEVQDFEHTIRSPLMQGRGLVDGEVHPELGPPNKGLSDDLDALAAYTNSHEFTPSPHAEDGLSEAARRGRELFFSEQTGCATCHSGPYFTDSTPGSEIVRHDVGTGGDDPTETMGPAYDTPTLLGVYRTAPYLHHGRAETLEDVLTTFNPEDEHGTTSHLGPEQISDLVEFLKSLPYRDPAAEAEARGMPRVAR